MKTFEDVQKELKEKNPAQHFSLKIVGELMAKRDRMGMTQRELAKRSGIAQKTISRIENGIDMPSLETVSKLAAALGMEIKVVESNNTQNVKRLEGEKEMDKEIAVHLSIYLPTEKDMTEEKAKEVVQQYLESKQIDDFQIYDIEVREI